MMIAFFASEVIKTFALGYSVFSNLCFWEDLLRKENAIVRILKRENGKVLIMDCIYKSVPHWISEQALSEYTACSTDDLSKATGVFLFPVEELDEESRRIAYERFTAVSAILPFIADNKARCHAICNMAEYFHISKQTIKHYLWLNLSPMYSECNRKLSFR
ncbi:MAG: hypothetical protein HFE78_02845 [Clostridiales bacterium]|nr:hypothetical protein [Clostridiales bacterium]